MKKVTVALFFLFVSAFAYAKPVDALPECQAMLEMKTQELAEAGWRPVGPVSAPFFLLIMENQVGQVGGIILAPDPFATEITESLNSPETQVETIYQGVCQIQGIPHLLHVGKDRDKAL